MPSSDPPPSLIELFVAPLNRLELTYMVTGSLAAGTYGEPRLTNDVDLVLALSHIDVVRLHDAFDESAFYVAPLEVMEAERLRPRYGHFNLIHRESAFKADVYLVGDDPLHAWGLQRRQRVLIRDEPVWLAPPEYIIIRKLQYFRDGGSVKHVADIKGMLAVLGDRIDRAALAQQIEALNLGAQWARAGNAVR